MAKSLDVCKGYTKKVDYLRTANTTQSFIQLELLRVQQKKISDRRLLLNSEKLDCTPEKLSYYSLHISHINASGTTFHACIFSSVFRSSNGTSTLSQFLALSMWVPNHLNITHCNCKKTLKENIMHALACLLVLLTPADASILPHYKIFCHQDQPSSS